MAVAPFFFENKSIFDLTLCYRRSDPVSDHVQMISGAFERDLTGLSTHTRPIW
jgi:hypothetical protein